MRPPPATVPGLALAGLAAGAAPALAHTGAQQGFVLTLPTGLYIAGGAAVVALTFVLVALVPVADVRAVERARRRLGRWPARGGTVVSLASLAVLAALVAAGYAGTPDPLANPLALAVWTLWWIGLTFAHALLGNLWAALNPWRGLYDLLAGLRLAPRPLSYPRWLGYWPALVQFLAFAWFELVHTAPQDPPVLADAVAAYFVLNLAGTLAFGREAWLGRGEAFSVFFRVVSWMSPLNARPEEERAVVAGPPGLGLLAVRPLPVSGVAFVLLMLSSVSFDGLSRTFRWLDAIGINPLAFPGRSAVVEANTAGLLGAFAALAGLYAAAVWLGHRLAGRPGPLAESLGRYVTSIVPIAFGYHFAHYLPAFLVDVQYAAIALSDPFGLGWDLLGLAHAHATASFLNEIHAVRLIWHVQVAAIVAAHVVAVLVAHAAAVGHTGRRRAAAGLLPLTALMVAYTLFGLWLLSAPAGV